MNKNLVTPSILASRWNVRINTLTHWRWSGRGPQFLKIGGRILYQIEDIEAFENQSRRKNTSQSFA